VCRLDRFKLQEPPSFASWVDNIKATLDVEPDKPLLGLNAVWRVITGPIRPPVAYEEPPEFLVEVTRRTDGLQGIMQVRQQGWLVPLPYISTLKTE
jgi:hypothetical protein